MEILMLSYWDFQNSGMQVTRRTPLYFAKKGHQIKFFVHSEQTSNPSKIGDLHPNIEIYRFNLPFKFLSFIPKLNRARQFIFFTIYSLFYSGKIYKGNRKPDVIYAAECDAILIGSILRRFYKVPLITRYYGLGRISANYDDVTGKYKRKWNEHVLTSLAITRKVNMVIMTDDGTNGLMVFNKLNPEVKEVKFWMNGIDKVELAPETTNEVRKHFKIKPDEIVLLTVSRLDDMKRVDRVIRSMPILAGQTTAKLRLLIVGDGPRKSSLQTLARELGVSEFVQFVGPVKHEEIYNFYAMADIFLSLYDISNVGNPLLEALNSGKCIITLGTGDTSRIIKNGKNGILLHFDTDESRLTEKIAGAVKNLVENDNLREELEKGAKAYANMHLWTWEERLETELKSIEELVENFRTQKR